MQPVANQGGAIVSNPSFISKYKWILIVLGVVIILGLIYYFTRSTEKKDESSSREYDPNESKLPKKEAEIMMFFVDWCPHCKTAKPEWDKVKAEYEGKEVNGYTIIFTDVNCTEATPETEKLISTYKIDGYPTIKLLKDNEVIEYEAKPNKDTLVQFLNSVL